MSQKEISLKKDRLVNNGKIHRRDKELEKVFRLGCKESVGSLAET